MSAADYPEHGEPPIRSALTFPPCTCGRPQCPNADANDDRSFSPTMRRLRPGVEEENRRWGWRHDR